MTVSARLIGDFEAGKTTVMTAIGEVCYLTDDINDVYVYVKDGATFLHYVEYDKGPHTVKLTNTTSWYTKIRDYDCNEEGTDIFGNTIHYLAPNFGIFIKVPENGKPVLVFNKD